MVKLQITACDRCGMRDDGGKVLPWAARRGQVRYTGDLCPTCWDELLNIFRPSNVPKGRHRIEATPIDQIPGGL